jgi:hypothetical protein
MNVPLPDLSSHKSSLLEESPRSILLQDPLTDTLLYKYCRLHPAQVLR